MQGTVSGMVSSSSFPCESLITEPNSVKSFVFGLLIEIANYDVSSRRACSVGHCHIAEEEAFVHLV